MECGRWQRIFQVEFDGLRARDVFGSFFAGGAR